MPANFISSVLILLVIAALAYRIPFLLKRKLFKLSLLQIMYFFIIPSLIFVLLNAHLTALAATPSTGLIAISDPVLINLTLLSVLFTFGGKAIHTVSKTLADTALRHDNTEVGQVNKFIHLNLSHNIMFAGGLLVILGLTTLEINHTPQDSYTLISLLVRGAILGLFFVVSMHRYTKSKDKYSGRWSDLKPVFLVSLLGLLTITFLANKIDGSLKEYQLLIPALLGMGLINAIPIILVIRRLRTRRSLSAH